MSKNLMPKIVLIIVLVLLAGWTLYPPGKTLKQGIDLAGGTSLIYEIDTYGLTEAEQNGLSQNMITVLRRRIDPANIQNIIWRPQGNTRFEIQMPLASEEASQKRENFNTALEELLEKNVSRSKVLQALKKSSEERSELFNNFAQDDPNRLIILEYLAISYDKRTELQNTRDKLNSTLETMENAVSSAGIELDQVQSRLGEWIQLDEQQLQQRLREFADSNDNAALLSEYVDTFSHWAEVVDELSEVNPQYREAMNSIDPLNLTEDQLNLTLELPAKSSQRREQINQLKTDFPDRAAEIDKVVLAYDEYRPFKGRLDDPGDLKRMLKGAGILEFRVLPTEGHPQVDADAMQIYIQRLEEKGPEYASDSSYQWCQIENINQWNAYDAETRPSIAAQFGDKYYVLASNKTDEVMLHSPGAQDWKLERAFPSTGEIGQRVIGFDLDERGRRLFANVTGKNIDRPLCILLDGIAISAPNIEERIPGEATIRGNFTQTEVEDMVNKLNAGSLPARLIEQPISENTIGPSIGADNRDKGIRAGLIGLAVVIACMAIYYRLSGSIADMALLLNILFVLAIMAGIRATFTLPGIAGIILTIGMSVDANVLIFERIREEQEKGSSLRVAIANGYQKAFRTILDANLTTLITAAILYWRASEEVRGFAIVLMLGIASSMFTALFVTRVVFDYLLAKRIIKEHLLMLRLIHNANVNWMQSRSIFFGLSALLIAAGLFAFFSRSDKYDIEFTGGTSVQINLNEGVEISRQQVEERIRSVLPAANVYSVGQTGRQYEINTTQTNTTSVTVTFPQTSGQTVAQVTGAIQKAQEQFAGRLSNLVVTQDTNNAGSFVIETSQMNQSLVKELLAKALAGADISEPMVDEVVNNAVLSVFADELERQQNLQPEIISQEKITQELLDSQPELADFLSGLRIECEIATAATLSEIDQRLKDLQFKPDTRDLIVYDYQILDSDLNSAAVSSRPVKSFIYVSTHPEAAARELSEDEWSQFVENERTKVLSSTSLEASLPRVRQFDPSVGSEQKTRAIIAIFLSLVAIVTYIWVRFGNIRYGLAAIIALVHDVCITLGAVIACKYIAATSIGNALLLGDFKIDLAMIAAFLTLIGYSLNDTIVVFDRIRENLGKARVLNPKTITDSINQTIPRTILTSFTTFIVILIMYIFGGQGLRGFTFAIGFGIIIGTYSSIAIAAPTLLFGGKAKQKAGK